MKIAVVASALCLIYVGVAAAHSGRLDKDGCHKVYAYDIETKRKVTVERHCHRTLGQGFRLDGSERLVAPGDDQTRDQDPPVGVKPKLMR